MEGVNTDSTIALIRRRTFKTVRRGKSRRLSAAIAAAGGGTG
jgi:hypothetical protein